MRNRYHLKSKIIREIKIGQEKLPDVLTNKIKIEGSNTALFAPVS